MPIAPKQISHVSDAGCSKPTGAEAQLTTPQAVIANRVNRIYALRQIPLTWNLLVLAGGRPYIDARLSRFPSESSIDWGGSSGIKDDKKFDSIGNIGAAGRKHRAYLANHAGRVAEKITQYVFEKPPTREGLINPDIARDIDRQGRTINSFMADVLKQIIAGSWCWIGIDAPKIDGQISMSKAKAEKIRPYWIMYGALDVVDWSFDAKGELLWLMTQGCSEDNSDPTAGPVMKHVRRLWEPGKMTEYEIDPGESAVRDGATIKGEPVVTKIDFDKVPFVPVGQITGKPHWYDDVENVQRAILDLESCLDTLYHKCVFAQPMLPASIAEDEMAGADMATKVQGILGYSNAILESKDDKGISRYIGPPSEAIKAMQTELERKRQILFDTVGLHLGFNKNFSESAESRMFDHLDPQAVLRFYTQQITEAETKAWELMHEWDSTIPAIVPVYADKFHVLDLYENMKALTLASSMDLPDGLRRLVLKGVKDNTLDITSMSLTPEQDAALNKEIAEQDFEVPIDLTPAARVSDGVDDQATDSGDIV